jgi:hypothetical protein
MKDILLKILGYLLTAILLLLSIGVLGIFLVGAVASIFSPISLPINARITDFESINITSECQANGSADITQPMEFPLSLSVNDPFEETYGAG